MGLESAGRPVPARGQGGSVYHRTMAGTSFTDRDPSPGERFGPFAIEDVLGEGGMSTVYRARIVDDDSIVALKVAKPSMRANDVESRRFAREARVSGDVSHAHLAPVTGCGEVDGRLYLAMPLLTGGTLAQRMADRGPLPMAEVIRLLTQVAGALDTLHTAGVVHRDVKPSNILLDDEDRAMLSDLGLVHVDGYSVLTQIGHVMGTMDYMAPEMISGGDVGPSVDIYALGCIAYQMISGRVPFGGGSLFEVAFGHLDQTAPNPAADRGDVSDEVAEVVQFALAKSPERRPPSSTAFARLLGVAARIPART
jgi:serine/threonine protein kinase, bacterial